MSYILYPAKLLHFVVLVRVLGDMLNNNQSQLFCSAASLYKKCCNSADGFSLWDKPEDRSKKRKKQEQKTEVRRRKGQKINRQKVRREVWMLISRSCCKADPSSPTEVQYYLS